MMVAAETETAAAAVMMPKSLRSSRRSGVGRGIVDVWRKHTSMYTVSHPIEPRDFDMFCFMTSDCPLLLLGLAFESPTPGSFSKKISKLHWVEIAGYYMMIMEQCEMSGNGAGLYH